MNWAAYRNDLFQIWPEIILAVTVLLALIVDLIQKGKDTRVTGWITFLGASFATWFVASALIDKGGVVEAQKVFGLLRIDTFALYFKLLLGIGLMCVLMLSVFFRGFDRDGIGEYYSILTACFVASGLTAGQDFLGKTLLNLASMFVIASGVAVGAIMVRRAREIRSADYSAFCPVCGYSLSSDPARCPECGHDLVPGSQRAT